MSQFLIVSLSIAGYLAGWYYTARYMIRTDNGPFADEPGLSVLACWLWPIFVLIYGAEWVGNAMKQAEDRRTSPPSNRDGGMGGRWEE
jgi:hypothetical protein